MDPEAERLFAVASALSREGIDPRTEGTAGRTRVNLDRVAQLIQELRALLFPGHFPALLDPDPPPAEVLERLGELEWLLARQIHDASPHVCPVSDACAGFSHAREVARAFVERLPALRRTLRHDVIAAYEGDPAAADLDEIILAYPGLLAVTVYRSAHELLELGVNLIPRMMTEWAHAQTGIDIHPGARIGSRFFIDHGTGVVVGQTTVIGDDVKLYQGVTLGAFSFPRDGQGRLVRNTKRHPTLEDGVTVYAGATILGGETVIGHHAVIGGNVYLTESVPPYSKVVSRPLVEVR